MMFSQMVMWLQTRINTDERGAAAVEYGLLVALIALVVIGVVATLGTTLQDTFQSVTDGILGD